MNEPAPAEAPLTAAPKPRLLTGTDARPFVTAALKDGPPAVAGEVRPATVRDVTAYFGRRKEAAAKSPDAEARVRAEFYAARVTAWDVVGADDAPAAVTAEAMLALPYPVWLQMEDIVLGFAGTPAAAKPA